MIKLLKKDYLKIIKFTLALFMAAINFNLFLKPINLVSGGASGLGLVLANLIPLSTSNLITIIYIITFIIGMIFLNKKAVLSTIYASIIYPVFIYLTEDIASIIGFSYHDIFLICIISGILSGISNGIAFKHHYTSGGLSVIPLIFNKYFKMSISSVNFVVNTITVLLGAYFYGFNMVIYAILLLYISSVICNMVILGFSRSKVLFVKSKKNDKIVQLLHDKYSISATILDNDEGNLLLVVVKNSDYSSIKQDLKTVDKKVFFTTNNCYDVGR